VGGLKVLSYTTGAYARIRRQFHQAIGKFEGIEEPLGRIGAFTYIADAARTFVTASIDAGEKPSVATAIVKYHTTELGRKAGQDGMDIHAGKGICLGPNNYLGRGYESSPIAITVEGANILTRSMIIFGQGAIRCHPYVLAELEAAREDDAQKALLAFDKAIMGHLGFAISNVLRSATLGLTGAWIVSAPKSKLKHYYQQATRFSSVLAFAADVSMLMLGGALKRKEGISSRLGDVLSYLYLLSAVMKHYHDQGEPADDFPIVQYACDYCLFEIQSRLDDLIRNFPNRFVAFAIRLIAFPLGRHFSKPDDKLNHKISQLLMSTTETRSRLTNEVFTESISTNVLASVQDALVKTMETEAIDKRIRDAKRDDTISGYTKTELAQSALNKGLISKDEFDSFMSAEHARDKVIAVDDFSNEELTRSGQ
jgi:acyl-CoA dehydrogenase